MIIKIYHYFVFIIILIFFFIVVQGQYDSYLIKKSKEVLPWKDFNKNMAIAVEYNLEY